MQKFRRTLFDRKQTWEAGGTSVLELPLDRWINKIRLRFKATYDSAAGADVAEDGVLNLVKKLSLKVNGKVIRSWKPARYWYTLPIRLGTKPELVDVTATTANDKTAKFHLPMIFRLDLDNEDDLSAALPARYLDNAEIEIQWAAAGVFGTNQTITAGELEVTLDETELTRVEEQQLYSASGAAVVQENSGLLHVVETEQLRTVDAQYDPHQFTMDLPTGGILTHSFLFATLNGARDDTLIPEYQIRQDAPTRHTYEEESWEAAQSVDREEYQFPTPIEGDYYLVGFVVLDYVRYGSLDLRARRTGEVRFRAETIAPNGTTNVRLLHEQVRSMPY